VTPYAFQVGDPQIILFLSPLQFAAIQKDNAYFAIYQQLTGMSNINVNFCLVESNSVLRVITFEFGNGVTYACGTGSTASAFVGYRLGLLDPVVKVVNRGGNLMISINPQERGQY
jgi:diaminopimelate epimerase